MFLLVFVLYNLLLFAGLLIIFPYYIYLFLKGNTRLLKDRFGLYDFKDNDYIWIHAASVGEVKIALRFINEFRKKSFEPIMLSVQTETGYKYAEGNLSVHTLLCYAPFDCKPIHCYIHYKANIKKLILIETELWPAMIHACVSNKIPVYLINARISDKTYAIYKKFGFLFLPLLNGMVCVCAQNETYKKRFIELGCRDYKIKVVSNLKYDLLDIKNTVEKKDALVGKKVFVAGSIRSGEEEIIINSYLVLRELFPELVCIIAPRHMHNVQKIINKLKNKGLSYIKYTQMPAYIDQGIIVVDVMGVLVDVYNMADVVFVGGSLVDKGGQNILEPIALGKPVIFGVYMQNFKDEARLIVDNNAGVQVKNSEQLTSAVKNILSDTTKAQDLVDRAVNLMLSRQGGTSQTVQIIFE